MRTECALSDHDSMCRNYPGCSCGYDDNYRAYSIAKHAHFSGGIDKARNHLSGSHGFDDNGYCEPRCGPTECICDQRR